MGKLFALITEQRDDSLRNGYEEEMYCRSAERRLQQLPNCPAATW